MLLQYVTERNASEAARKRFTANVSHELRTPIAVIQGYVGMLERWGKRTLDWCRDIGFIGPDVWYAHGWELTPEESAILDAAIRLYLE